MNTLDKTLTLANALRQTLKRKMQQSYVQIPAPRELCDIDVCYFKPLRSAGFYSAVDK